MIRKIKKIRNSGFTIIQTVIVIVILGALAGMAIPRMITLTYKVKNQEALPVLISLLEAQFDYKRVNGSYTTTLSDLDVTIPTLQNFESIIVYGDGAIPLDCGSGDQQRIAAIDAVSDSGPRPYSLTILEDGRICCTIKTAVDQGGICARMGFNN